MGELGFDIVGSEVERWREYFRSQRLPAEMSESAVGLSLLVNIVTLADGVSLALGGVLEFVGKSAVHRNATTSASIVDQPTHRQRLRASRRDFEGDLISSSTDATCLGLNPGLGVFNRTIEELKGVNSPILGVVLNGVDMDRDGYYYYQYYYYYYGEDGERKKKVHRTKKRGHGKEIQLS